ncbi:coiled-coil domain-containing protein 186 isoform X2 [Aricia agestis]|uniref:coiled-coil domain-containing protein 186 isoform X2 n=1 Tax=Aricia agestis TaxID=91739 RepID=UPI001C201765|nr:coiled-coil domain-containing protein 186 isoform X2 [Aricia agestis]
MSVESDQNLIESVDVAEVKENGTKSEICSDSGVETLDSQSTNYQSSSESEISPTKITKSAIELEDESNSSALHILNNTALPVDTKLSSCENDIQSLQDDPSSCSGQKELANDNINILIETVPTDSVIDSQNEESDKSVPDKILIEEVESKLLLETNLTASTTSLNDQADIDNFNYKLNSRSAENISNIENNLSSTSSTTDLEKDYILSQFTQQKIKASSTQKIPEPQVYDARYSRIPKEILSQDLGSIVKNVHGIFSSVSGSLKNAYTNSQRVPKPVVKNIKMPNGKVMNDIFEDTAEKEKESVEPVNLTSEQAPNLNEVPPDTVENKNDLYKLQIESLEKVLSEQRKENASLREKVKQQVDELQAKDQMFKELEVKVDLMCRKAEQAQKEKDAAVMRYASVECQAIEAKRQAEAATKAEKAAYTERDLMTTKLKTAREEKQRICQLYDDKCHELQTSEREVGKVREEVRELEGRLKWTQSKLRMEMDAFKECAERAEKLSQQVSELEAARETAAVNATDSLRAKQLESDLKESQAALILCRHERDDLERRLTAALQQLDACKRERDDAVHSLALANTEVEKLKESNLRLEEEAAELAALRARAALADTLSSQLDRESERAAAAEAAAAAASARAETCARREAAALEHAAQLTAQHVAAANAARDCTHTAQALTADNASLREKVTSLEGEVSRLKTTLDQHTEKRQQENRVLARKVAELTEELQESNKKLEWEQGENNVLKKKHASAIREMNRELQRALKRVEQLEAKLPPTADADSNRTGSVSSLSSGEGASNGERTSSDVPQVEAVAPDRQALIERIVSLQRAAARRAERCEFLEEHARALTAELRGKARLLRRLLPALPPAALAPTDADAAKQELARLGGGAMAAVWGGDPAGLTPELSLEMNRRLQALLEDTLLKNITLKDNIDTLGEEIARLKAQKNITDSK